MKINTKGFKRHFFYKEDNITLTDSWIRTIKGEAELIDLRDMGNTKEVMLEYFIGKKNKRIIFPDRKEGLKYIKKEFNLE